MSSWWSSLQGGSQFYWAVAIFASALQILMLLGSVVGGYLDFNHGDAGPDTAHGDHSEGVRFLSFRIVAAFFVGFGWCGVLGLQTGMSGLSTAVSACVTGLVFMLLLFGTLRLLLAMRADGTLNYRNAIGQAGHVYVTIPPARSGPGQVEILLQGRLITASAVTDAALPLPPRAPIKVTAVEGASLLIVQPSPFSV